ncbi:transposase [Alphaproteobacteria bacterium]|nr:transposase [Alphaproteobacteria bacterium]
MSKQYSAQFKSEVALVAIKEEMTTAEMSKKYGVSPSVINRWRREATESLSKCFAKADSFLLEKESAEEKIAMLERKVGQLTLDNDFLKKNYSKYCLIGERK